MAVRTIRLLDASVDGNELLANTCSVTCRARGCGFVVQNLAIMLV